MKRKYGVMLIGCGYIAEEHIADVYYRENVHVVAVVDIEPERARMLAHKYGVKEYDTKYEPYLQRDDVDIVIIATYVDSHLSIMKKCVEAGKHVLCEKPVAATREEGEEFFRIADHAQTQVMVGHILRYNRSYLKVRELVQEGVIGSMRFIRFVQNHHALNWKRYKRLLEDCPPVLDCGVHYLDVMQWVSGQKICKIRSTSFKVDKDAPCDNYWNVQMQLSGGCCGCYEAGWGKNIKAYNCKEFVGEKGYIRLTLQADRAGDKEEGDLIELYNSDTGEYLTYNVQSKYKDMNAQLQELINRIEGKPQNEFTIQDAREAFIAAMDAISYGYSFSTEVI